MPQKPKSGQLRSHSRNSSTTKLTSNLQLTQKDAQPGKQLKKSDTKPPSVRANSSQRVRSREHIAPPLKKLQATRPTNTNTKSAFTIASPSENADGDEDEEWVSSESGAGTPNQQDSDSETASETDEPQQDPTLVRIDTAKPSDFVRPPQPRKGPASEPQAPGDASPRPSINRRYSRPPSTHSISSRADHALRPHPLIRGASYGRLDPAPKPPPLAPLTVIPNAALPKISTSPPNNLSSSPSSPKTSSGSPMSDIYPGTADGLIRRLSFSSIKSFNTIPIHSTIPRESNAPALRNQQQDRIRTQSMISNSTATSSSSAAISSLAHLPSVTRPPSPQTVVFFPRVNPHHNTDGIHPLLPTPYLNNHLTILARRTPIRESFDRVVAAKYGR